MICKYVGVWCCTMSENISNLRLFRRSDKISQYCKVWAYQLFNPLTAKLFNLNFHPLEVVTRWRDPQLQASENYSYLAKWRLTVFKYNWLMSHFIFVICWKGGTVLIKNENSNICDTGGYRVNKTGEEPPPPNATCHDFVFSSIQFN